MMIDEVFIVKIKCVSFLLFGQIFFGHTKKYVQIIKKKYIMTNIDTQETDYSVFFVIDVYVVQISYAFHGF
jgi:hypothetical protein